jgi:hypothetical protein
MSRLLNFLLAASLAVCLAVWAPARAAEPGVQAPIGLKLLDLPLPAGFADATRDLPQMRTIGERMTPPSNRLLAVYMSQEDHQRAKGGQAPAMQRYFMVQTLRQAESATVSPAEFAELKSVLRQQYKGLVEQAGKQVQGLLDSAAREIGRDGGVESLSLKAGEMKGLEVFEERSNSISLLAATRFVVQAEGRSQEVPMSMAITTAVLKGKLLYFYAYAVYRDVQDLDWLRSVTRDWLTLADASNPP